MKKIFLTFLTPALILTFLMPQFAEALATTGTCTYVVKDKQGNIVRRYSTQGENPENCVAGSQKGNAPDGAVFVESYKGTGAQTVAAAAGGNDANWFDTIFQPVLAGVVGVILKFVALLTTISGVLLNAVIYYTVVEVSNNYSRLTPIMEAWRVLRDIANMTFIFVLLYAAIRTILGQGEDNKRVIVSVVVVAALMNFSLFFTRIVIDIANVFAITFYDAIAPGALNATGTLQGWGIAQAGLSNAFMEYLSLTTLYKMASTIDLNGLVMVGLMGSILLLIAAFVFFAIALMFIIRYVVLILVMILSPLYFVSWALPSGVGLGKYKKQWEDALFGQAFFAPIYFLLTWVAIKVMSGMSTAFQLGPSLMADEASLSALSIGNTLSSGAFLMFMNFAIVIVLMVVSLIVAKEWAGKGGLGALSGWATKAAGSSLGGGVGWIGRKTVGKGGEWVSTRTGVQEWANKETGLKGAAGRLALYAGKKARSGTFDARNATVPTNVIGAAIEGTLGRTVKGKKFGLDEVRIPSIPIGRIAADQTGAGKGGTEGYKEEQAAKAKRMGIAEKATTEEYRSVKSRAIVMAGVDALPASPEYKAMEKELAKMSDKEVEAIADANQELLNKLSFANSISVKQLEAINKSDKFSDEQKEELKKRRFAAINTAVLGGPAAIIAAKGDIQALADAELEMIDPTHLSNTDFVAQLKQSQVDAIQKSNKFTTTQKRTFKEERERPLKNAFATPVWAAAKDIMQKMGEPGLAKMNAGYDPAVPTTHTEPHLNNPNVVGIYTPSILNKMAAQAELNPNKRNAVRDLILNAVHGDPAMSAALASLTPAPGHLRVTPAQRRAALAPLTPEQRKIVSSAEWLEGENGQQIF